MPTALMETAAALPQVAHEGLDNLMVRLDRVNNYEEKDWLERDFGLSRPLLSIRSQADYALISALTELDPAEIWSRTVHRYAPSLLLPGELGGQQHEEDDMPLPFLDGRWLDLSVMGQTRRYPRKICPHHWREERNLLLPWAMRHVTACPTHKALLVDHCRCGEKLHFDPRVGLCPSCDVDVGTLEAPSIADDADSLALTALVWAALGHGDVVGAVTPEGHVRVPLPLPEGHPFEDVTPAALFRVATALVNLLTARDRGNPFFAPAARIAGARSIRLFHHRDNASVHAALLCLWRLIADWPAAWEALLVHVAAAERRRGDPDLFPYALIEALPGPDFTWLWHAWGLATYAHLGRAPGVFRWLKVYQFARRHLDPTLPRLRTLDQVGRALGVSRAMLDRHVAAGELAVRRGRWGATARPVTLVDEESMERLVQLRATRLNFVEALGYLGVGRVALTELVKGGILPCARRGATAKAPWLFEKGAIDDALGDMIGRLPVRAQAKRAVSRAAAPDLTLADALASLRAAGVGLPAVLRLAQSGEVTAHRLRDSIHLSDLRFDAASIDTLLANHVPEEGAPRYTSTEVCRLLRCTQVTLRLWAEAGLLIPLGTRGLAPYGASASDVRAVGTAYYDGADIDLFKERYVGAEEGATILGCHPTTLHAWVHAGKLDAALVRGGGKGDVFLFDRARLGELAAERMTGSEAARLLGVDVKTINNWMARGLIAPIGDPTAKGRRYLRDDVLRLANHVRRRGCNTIFGHRSAQITNNPPHEEGA